MALLQRIKDNAAALYALLLCLVIVVCALGALQQVLALKDATRFIQTRIAPVGEALTQVKANFRALGFSNVQLREQLSDPSAAQVTDPTRFTARIQESLNAIGRVRMDPREQMAFYSLRNSLGRFNEQQGRYRALVAAGNTEEAAGFYDTSLRVSVHTLSAQIEAFEHLNRAARDALVARKEAMFSQAAVWFFTSVGVSLIAGLLLMWRLLRTAARRKRHTMNASASVHQALNRMDDSAKLVAETTGMLARVVSSALPEQPLQAKEIYLKHRQQRRGAKCRSCSEHCNAFPEDQWQWACPRR